MYFRRATAQRLEYSPNTTIRTELKKLSDMLNKNVLCQTDLTMAKLEKIEQELKILTTKQQCSKQEQKLGISAEKKESC